MTQQTMRFDGVTFDPALDGERLTKQIGRVFETMRDGRWRTLHEIASTEAGRKAGDSEAGISARLRDLRKPRFGAYTVDRRRRETATGGTWEYRVTRGG